MRRRLLLVVGLAVPLVAADLTVKAVVSTDAWDFHRRSGAWEFLSAVLVVGCLALARVPSSAVAVGAGLTLAGTAANLLSALHHGGSVPNPIVVGNETSTVALNLADVWALSGLLLLMISLLAVTIRNRRLLPPPLGWYHAARRRFARCH